MHHLVLLTIDIEAFYLVETIGIIEFLVMMLPFIFVFGQVFTSSAVKESKKKETASTPNASKKVFIHKQEDALITKDPIYALDIEIQTLKRRVNELQIMINNSNEGFILINKELNIVNPYSFVCYQIFKQEILGEAIVPLVAANDHRKQKHLDENLNAIFSLSASDPMLQTFISLLPKEYEIKEQFYAARYERISEHQLMVILANITKRKALETELEQEHNELEFIVNALVNRSDFLELVNNFRKFIEKTAYKINEANNTNEAELLKLFKEIHTSKSHFYQMHFPTVPALLNQLEIKLWPYSQVKNLDLNAIRNIIYNCPLESTFERDLALIHNHIPDDYFQNETKIHLSENDILHLESLALDPHNSKDKLLRYLHKLRCKPLDVMLQSQFRSASYLAAKTDKAVQINYLGDKPFIEANIYKDFISSLTHLFRNAIDHGIETKEERVLTQKSAVGHIHVFVVVENERLHLEIKDDGRGIDILSIKEKAFRKDLIKENQLDSVTELDLLPLIFEDGFSSLSECTTLSGRGVGLSAVRDEVHKLDGKISVETEAGAFTAFHIDLPLYSVML